MTLWLAAEDPPGRGARVPAGPPTAIVAFLTTNGVKVIEPYGSILLRFQSDGAARRQYTDPDLTAGREHLGRLTDAVEKQAGYETRNTSLAAHITLQTDPEPLSIDKKSAGGLVRASCSLEAPHALPAAVTRVCLLFNRLPATINVIFPS